MNYHYRFLKEKTVMVSSVCYISPLQELDEIALELKSKNYYGEVVFDLLCVNGNQVSNRFVSINFDGEYFDSQKAKTLTSPDKKLIKLQDYFYQHHQDFLASSTLSAEQRRNFVVN